MSIDPVKVPGWVSGDELSFTEINGLQENTVSALDKRTGETDTLESEVTVSGTGKIIIATAAPDPEGFLVAAGGQITGAAGAPGAHIEWSGTATFDTDSEVELGGENTMTGLLTATGTTVFDTGSFTGFASGSEVTMLGTAKLGVANHLQFFSARTFNKYAEATHYQAADWDTLNGFGSVLNQVDVATPTPVYYELAIPDGCTLTGVQLTLRGVGGHGALPPIMPSIEVKKLTVSTGTITTIGSLTLDTSATVIDYELVHTIDITGLAEVVDRDTAKYCVEVIGEGGGGSAAAGLRLYGMRVTYTTTTASHVAN